MSLTSMIAGVSIPLGMPGSILKNPAEKSFTDLSLSKDGMTKLSAVFTGALDAPSTIGIVTGSISYIDTNIQRKVSTVLSDVHLSTTASMANDRVVAIDAIISNTVDTSPPIEPGNVKFTSQSVKTAMAPITDSESLISDKLNLMSSGFDINGNTLPLYDLLNAIPGVSLTNGRELLTFLGDVPVDIESDVNAALATAAGIPTVATGISDAFTLALPAATDLQDSYTSMIDASDDIMKGANDFLTGLNFVTLIDSPNPFIAGVLSSVVSTVDIDRSALSLIEAVNTKVVKLSGQVSTETVTAGRPEADTFPTYLTAGRAATIDKYTPEEIDVFLVKIDEARIEYQDASAACMNYLVPEIENWKTLVDYEGKKTAAGVTPEFPDGTTTNPVIRAEWVLVRDEFGVRSDIYNSTLLPALEETSTKYSEITVEYEYRTVYGRYPYTVAAAAGTPVPPSQQYTYLDTTK